MSNSQKPSKITLLAYNVGFGDCLLLRFDYGAMQRHVLIDFGTTSPPLNAGKNYMRSIAESIHEECGGKLDALVATHRHADHINGFDTDTGPGKLIADCEPSLVVRGWTEDPAAAADATGPSAAFVGAGSGATTASLAEGRQFVARLDEAGKLAADVAKVAAKKGATRGTGVDLAFLAAVNSLPNQSAVSNLETMTNAASEKPPRYVYYGAESGLGKVLPGVKVTTLGPPTLDQSSKIHSETSQSPEFWMLAPLAAKHFTAASGAAGTPGAGQSSLPPYARWLQQRIATLNLREMLEIVRQLDDVMNNTSAILLFEVGPVKLLFPGDAQIENWSYALAQPGVRDMLKDVNLYKVGHHGSLNATPKSMWNGFVHKGPAGSNNRLITALSTKAGKHGSEAKHTEVPRKTLVDALKAGSEYYDTELTEQGKLFQEIRVPM